MISDRLMTSQRVRDILLFFFFFLFFFLLFFLLLFLGGSVSSAHLLLLTLGCLGVSGLLAWTLTEPLGQAGLGPLGPVIVLLLPHGLEHLGPDDLPATFVQL